eukprot:SAG11_NODE_5204_length_1631_cov_1.122715_3_plen_79_part_01
MIRRLESCVPATLSLTNILSSASTLVPVASDASALTDSRSRSSSYLYVCGFCIAVMQASLASSETLANAAAPPPSATLS